MYHEQTVGVVVPAYNEEGLVGAVIDTVPAFVDRVYVVDDRSTDDTWAEISEHAARENATGAPETDGGRASFVAPGEDDGGARSERVRGNGTDAAENGAAGGAERTNGEHRERVVAIRHRENRGVGGAITTGYRRALADGMDVIAVMNGDGQMNPAALGDVLDPVVEGRAAYAKGNRLRSAADREGMTRWRTFGNASLTLLTRLASGYWDVTDPQNGYTAISADALEEVDLDELYEEYGFCNDLLAALNHESEAVVDVPLAAEYGEEESTIRYGTFIPRVSTLLGRHFLDRLRRRYLVEEFHPLVLLYPVGALAAVAGAYEALRGRWDDADGGRGGNALVLLAVGALSVVLALVFDREAERRRERAE